MGQMIPKFRKEKEEKPIGGCMSSPTVSYEADAGSEGRKYQPKIRNLEEYLQAVVV